MARTVFKAEMDKWPSRPTIAGIPDIPINHWFKPGDEFRVETYDWTGGQIKNDDSANDIRDVDLSKVHYLSGPFGCEGAEPGDLLKVDINDIGWLEDSSGASPASSRWRTAAASSTSTSRKRARPAGTSAASTRPRATFPASASPDLIHPGLIGTLPSADLLATWNRREAALFEKDPTGFRRFAPCLTAWPAPRRP